MVLLYVARYFIFLENYVEEFLIERLFEFQLCLLVLVYQSSFEIKLYSSQMLEQSRSSQCLVLIDL